MTKLRILQNQELLLLIIIKILPSTCGVTIFGDKAQAIYGFTNDEEKSDSNNAENLMDYLETNNKNFQLAELKKYTEQMIAN